MLVTLTQAKTHLRIDSDADDAWLAVMIAAVSDAVLLWLKDEWRAYDLARDSNGVIVVDSNGDPVPQADSNGDPIVRGAVVAATLVELASQYRYREGEGAPQAPSAWGHGYVLGPGATSLLAALRRSTVA